MKDLYTKEYLENTLFNIKSAIKELKEWSAYNSDEMSLEIFGLSQSFKMITDLFSKKATAHVHNKKCLRYGNLDIHYYCSKTMEEISDKVADEFMKDDAERDLVKDLDQTWKL